MLYMAAQPAKPRGKSRSASTATKGSRGGLEVINGGKGAPKSIQGEKNDVLGAIEGMDDEFRECRGDIHEWRTLGHWRNAGLIIKRRQCDRCTTARTIVYSERNGGIVDSWYEYPDGYSIKGHGQIDRAKFRTVHFQTITIYESEEAMLKSVLGGRKR